MARVASVEGSLERVRGSQLFDDIPSHRSRIPMASSIVAGQSGSDTVATFARSHPSLVTLAKAGWLAKGVVYTLVGILAVRIVVDGLTHDDTSGAQDEASQSGAIGEIAGSSLGTVALWLVAVGLGLYVLWRLVSIALPAENSASAWATRAGYLVSAIVYASLAWTAISFARHRGSGAAESEDSKVEGFTRDLMEASGGRWIVGMVGIAVVGIAAYFGYKGISASFRDELEPGGVGPLSQQTIVRLGQVGWVGRGVMMLLVGWFLIQAAVNVNPDEARGLDGALREATSTTAGGLLAAIAAFGLIAYGVFCGVSAPRARLTNAD
jgi:Domain of Unknown Function (DUF1206)